MTATKSCNKPNPIAFPLATCLVLGTLMTHIENFTMEVDQYLTVLAINDGALPNHKTDHMAEGTSKSHKKKVPNLRII